MEQMIKITIDSEEVEVPAGYTIMQACDYIQKEVPRFCYHDRLSIAGNCRICLVEVEKMPKPVASCTQPVAPDMRVKTNSDMVKKAREGVMEFMLINHPLDCPICDKGGECDLQDQAMFYGRADSRFEEQKRAVKDKYMGPLIKTAMNRCIHCTRCVRFIEEIAGTSELGAIGRGENMEVTTYVEKSIKSELSGNIIDLCPVGALTSHPYAFRARPWELQKTESIDVLDALCANIRLDSKSGEILRVLPVRNDLINEEWISDKTRFSYDGLMMQRLDVPMLRQNQQSLLAEAEYSDVLEHIAEKIGKNKRIGAAAGDLTDIETMVVMKNLLDQLPGSEYDCRQEGASFVPESLSLNRFNLDLADIMKADVCLIIGSNPRLESPVFNTRLRRAVIENKMKVAVLGKAVDLSYDYQHLTDNPWFLKQIIDNNHQYCNVLENAQNPLIIVGSGVSEREDFEAFIYYLKRICKKYNVVRQDWAGLNFLQRAASRVGGMAVGFISGSGVNSVLSESDVLFLLGADEVDMSKIKKDAFVVYIGHHGDAAASRADAILPAPAFTEKNATYINLEGRVQCTQIAAQPVGEALPDWQIINDLTTVMGLSVRYSDLKKLRTDYFKKFGISKYGEKIPLSEIDMRDSKMRDFIDDKLQNPVTNFYMTNTISRNSKIMAKCVDEIL